MLVMYQHLHYHFPPASRKKGKENLNIKGNSAKKKVLLFVNIMMQKISRFRGTGNTSIS